MQTGATMSSVSRPVYADALGTNRHNVSTGRHYTSEDLRRSVVFLSDLSELFFSFPLFDYGRYVGGCVKIGSLPGGREIAAIMTTTNLHSSGSIFAFAQLR
ncbi:unnamed protein product [Nippostrongylus brasiliensis]|uniref:Dirigent protein n=1 Tax=Nippostrongylus brasiliensis TaxID=27835 RepID=A0A0N4YSM4_NIPBR|nr:unnamed protein product [Nippostrongylus brasiliensis]